MEKDIMAIPMSTVASKSGFSTRGRILETYRSSLESQMVEGLICIHNWLKPSFTYFKDLQLMEETNLSEEIVTGKSNSLFLISSKVIMLYISHKLSPSIFHRISSIVCYIGCRKASAGASSSVVVFE
jgi:hypothetical protein